MDRPDQVLVPPAKASAQHGEEGVWIGVAVLAMMCVRIPLAILGAFGFLGFAVLWVVLGFLTALKFDLFFLLWSVCFLLPVVVMYLLGCILRIPLRRKPFDFWLHVFGFFAPLAVFFLGVEQFAGTVGWDGVATWTNWAAVFGFALAYLGAFVAGITGAGRSLDQ